MEHIGSLFHYLKHKKHIAAGVMKQLNNQSAQCKPSQGKMLEILCVGASMEDLIKKKCNSKES